MLATLLALVILVFSAAAVPVPPLAGIGIGIPPHNHGRLTGTGVFDHAVRSNQAFQEPASPQRGPMAQAGQEINNGDGKMVAARSYVPFVIPGTPETGPITVSSGGYKRDGKMVAARAEDITNIAFQEPGRPSETNNGGGKMEEISDGGGKMVAARSHVPFVIPGTPETGPITVTPAGNKRDGKMVAVRSENFAFEDPTPERERAPMRQAGEEINNGGGKMVAPRSEDITRRKSDDVLSELLQQLREAGEENNDGDGKLVDITRRIPDAVSELLERLRAVSKLPPRPQ